VNEIPVADSIRAVGGEAQDRNRRSYDHRLADERIPPKAADGPLANRRLPEPASLWIRYR
jgi:hypothetical protein